MFKTFVGQQLDKLHGRHLGRLDLSCRNAPGWQTM